MSLLGRWMGQRPAQPQTTMAAPLVATGKPGPISHADAKQFGFVNFGNTCYANSVLQALYFCAPFRELVCASPDRSALFPTPPPLPTLTVPQPSTASTTTAPAGSPVKPAAAAAAKPKRPNAANGEARTEPEPVDSTIQGLPIPTQPPSLFSALRALFIHISLHPVDRATVSPSAFVAKLKQENELFSGTMHQDAHEFLNYLLNKIVEDLGEEEKLVAQDELSKSIVSLTAPSTVNSNTNSAAGHNHATLVHSLFEGTLTSETRCLTCETVSSRDESFLDLSIDIEQNSSVTACLRQFSASEMLCEKNKFFCDSCCGLQEAERRMKVKKLPNVLALHLKRFKYQEDLQKYIKLSYRVAFPFELRLFNTVDDAPNPDRLYELFAIVVHIGGGPHHGHYITIVKSRGVWLVFDDDSVDTIKEKDIPRYFGDSPGGAGYVLFYEAVDLDPASVGIVRTEPALQTPSDLSVRGANSEPSATAVSSETGSDKGEHSIPPSPNITSIVQPRPPLNLDIPPPGISADPPPASPVLEVQSATISSGNQGGLSFITRSLRPSASMRVNRLSLNSNTSSNGHPPLPKSPSMPFKNFAGTLPKATTLSPEPTLNGKEKEKDKDKDKKWFGSRKVKVQRNSVQPPVPPLPPQPGSHSAQPTVLYEDGNGGLSNRRPSAVSSRSSNDYRRPSAPAALESHSLSPAPPLPVNDASSESSSSFAAENTTASTTPTGSSASKRSSTLIFPPTPNTLLVPTPDMTPRSSTSVASSNTTTIVTASSSQSHALMNHSRPTSTTSLNSRSSPTPGPPPPIPPLLPDPPPSPRAFKQSVRGIAKVKKVADAADKKVREKAEKEREKAEKEREKEREKAEKERERAEVKAEKEREKAEREREKEREKAEREREKSEREWERVEREREERDVVDGEHRHHDEPGLKPAKSLKRASRKLSFSAIPVSGIFTGGFGKKDRDRDTSHPPSSMSPPTTTIHPIAASGPPPTRTPRSPERQPERTAIRIESQPRFGF